MPTVSLWPEHRREHQVPDLVFLRLSPHTPPDLKSVLSSQDKRDGWSSNVIFVSHHGKSELPSYSELFDRIGNVNVTLIDDCKVHDHSKSSIVPSNDAPALITPPWCELPNLIAIIAGRKYYDDIVKPTVADVQFEYLEAMRRGDDRIAACIKWLGLLRILLAAAISPVMRICRIFSSQKA